MSRWTCRRCGAGFPDPVVANGGYACPWCGETIEKWLGDTAQKHLIAELLDEGESV